MDHRLCLVSVCYSYCERVVYGIVIDAASKIATCALSIAPRWFALCLLWSNHNRGHFTLTNWRNCVRERVCALSLFTQVVRAHAQALLFPHILHIIHVPSSWLASVHIAKKTRARARMALNIIIILCDGGNADGSVWWFICVWAEPRIGPRFGLNAHGICEMCKRCNSKKREI